MKPSKIDKKESNDTTITVLIGIFLAFALYVNWQVYGNSIKKTVHTYRNEVKELLMDRGQ